ncbi:MAG: alkylphosphonate utilization protein [Pseudomonadales bacterium]|nr:alkylphosphonate utilization protein [Pseudomonadales bacterium]
MSTLPPCPACASTYTYTDPGGLFVCPECAHEWTAAEDAAPEADAEGFVVKDVHGNVLSDGDTVTMVKDLKVKGSTTGLKAGTRIKNIRLVEGDHNIDCKVDGLGAIGLKSEFVRKA